MMNTLHKLFLQHSPRQFAGYVVLCLSAIALQARAISWEYTFDACGGIVDGKATSKHILEVNTYAQTPYATHTNKTLRCVGWYNSSDYHPIGRLCENGGSFWNGYGLQTFYAKWVEDRYPIFFVSNFGTDKTTEQWVTASEKIKLNANSFSRSGFRFLGWSTDRTANKPTWSDGQVDVNLDQYRNWNDSKHLDEDGNQLAPVTLYAVWGKQFTLSFVGNGGGGSMNDFVLDEGVPTTLPKCTFTPPVGMRFYQWSCDKTFIGDNFDEAELTYTSATWGGSMATLTAKWTSVSYFVRFNANTSASVSGTMSDQPMDYGISQNLWGCQFKRVGYEFAGWAETADGAVKYADKADVVNLSATDGAIVNLYAKWTPISYAVKFDAAGGEGEMAVMDCEYDQAYPLPANVFTRDGGTFAGWTTNGASGVVFEDRATISNLSSVANSTNVLRAVWSNIAYRISFGGNGGEGSVPAMDCEYGTVYQLPSNDFTRTGYLFAGWTTNAAMPAVYAEGASVSNLTITADATVELFAAWRPVVYRVVFDANGGEGEMAPMTCTYDIGYSLPSNSFVKLGRAFSGWADSSSGEVVYADGVVVSNLVAVEDGECRLYAVWVKELSDLNAALDNDVLTVLRDPGADAFVTVVEDVTAENGSCVKINRNDGNDATKGFRIYLDSPGKLTFRWKVVNVFPETSLHIDGFLAKVRLEEPEVTNDVVVVDRKSDYTEPELEWEDVSISVGSEPASVQFVFKGHKGSGSEQLYALFDNVRWTTGGNPDPTEADAPVINGAATVEGGRFRVTFAADGRFKYELIKSDSLAPADWKSFEPRMFVTPEADGAVSFEPEMDPAKPQMFYRVKVLKKD